MKQVSLLVFFWCLRTLAVAQPMVAGTWEGKLATGGSSIRLVVELTRTDSGYAGFLRSPDQSASRFPLSRVVLTGDSLLVEAASINGKALGRLVSDTTFDGEWWQGPVRLPLFLKKVEKLSTLNRPQTPVPPFAYKTEDVLYYNKDSSIRYGATLTLPSGKGPFATLLLVTGSGQQNRDEELFGHKPFAVLADYLTKQGYAVLRVDDRGVGQSTGNVSDATSLDFAGDVGVGLNYLKSRADVDKTNLGLLGHSEGGMIAQLVASARNDVAFSISLAGPGQPINDLLADQNTAVLASTGVSPRAAKAYGALFKTLLPMVAKAGTDSAAKLAGIPVVEQWLRNTPDSLEAAYAVVNPEKTPASYMNGMLQQVRSPWFRYFAQYNPGPFIQKMAGKVLVLNGSRDIQVMAGPNLAGWRQNLAKSRAKWEIKELPGLNHLFQRCRKCTVAEYGELEETMAPETLEAIGDWLKRNVPAAGTRPS